MDRPERKVPFSLLGVVVVLLLLSRSSGRSLGLRLGLLSIRRLEARINSRLWELRRLLQRQAHPLVGLSGFISTSFCSFSLVGLFMLPPNPACILPKMLPRFLVLLLTLWSSSTLLETSVVSSFLSSAARKLVHGFS